MSPIIKINISIPIIKTNISKFKFEFFSLLLIFKDTQNADTSSP